MAQDIFVASSENLKELKKHRNRLKCLVNRAIRENSLSELDSLTKVYALLYSAYVEVSFLKLIHTPKAFSDSEIQQVEKKRNLEEKWEKCFELAFKKLNTNANKGEISNKKQALNRILLQYIIGPSLMRNKIAHGQWARCLNNDCTKENQNATSEMKKMDFVQIDRYFSIYDKFQQCILDIAVSPRTHYRDYYSIMQELQLYVNNTSTWTIETKKQQLLSTPKYIRYKNKRQ